MPKKNSRILDGKNGQKLKEVLEKKLDELNDLLERNSQEREKTINKSKTLSLLESVTFGLYIETEKLCRKKPELLATNLIVEQVNQVIKETKETVEDDPYIERLKEFVPAGTNPEIQDVVIVLKQISQGLVRYKGKPSERLKSIANERFLMNLIHESLDSLLDDNEELTKSDFENGMYYSSWFNDKSPYSFNFKKLEETDLYDYFGHVVEEGDEGEEEDYEVEYDD
jgi:hypothetical protein